VAVTSFSAVTITTTTMAGTISMDTALALTIFVGADFMVAGFMAAGLATEAGIADMSSRLSA
jgi:hypothetical protein